MAEILATLAVTLSFEVLLILWYFTVRQYSYTFPCINHVNYKKLDGTRHIFIKITFFVHQKKISVRQSEPKRYSLC